MTASGSMFDDKLRFRVGSWQSISIGFVGSSSVSKLRSGSAEDAEPTSALAPNAWCRPQVLCQHTRGSSWSLFGQTPFPDSARCPAESSPGPHRGRLLGEMPEQDLSVSVLFPLPMTLVVSRDSVTPGLRAAIGHVPPPSFQSRYYCGAEQAHGSRVSEVGSEVPLHEPEQPPEPSSQGLQEFRS